MRGAGRLKTNGFNIEWGVGRHGPGDNVFTYFVEPNGFVVEYTTEVEQIDESTYMPQRRRLLARVPDAALPLGHGRTSVQPPQAAMGGDTSVANAEDGKRCEEIMAKKLGR